MPQTPNGHSREPDHSNANDDAPPTQVPLGSIFDDDTPRSRQMPPSRSPFARFANDDPSVPSNTNTRWTVDETEEPVDPDRPIEDEPPAETIHVRTAAPAPERPRPATPPSAFAGVSDTPVFPPTKMHAVAGPVAADRHGLSGAVSRLTASSQAAGGAGFTVLGALLAPGERVDHVVVGTSLGMPTVAALTATRVIVISEQRWVPEVEVFQVDNNLTVHGRHANDQASLTFGDHERLVTVDQIIEVPIAVELATILRSRISGTEF